MYDEQDKLCCKENFYWKKPGNPYRKQPETLQEAIDYFSYIPSEYLLSSKTLEEDGKIHFCTHFAYDLFGNIIKSSLWGNLTGSNSHDILLKNGTPIDNGCEVYTKEMEYSQNGLNLLLYENNGRKWVRSTYYPRSNLLKSRFTGSDQSILRREFFRYDSNAVLIEEIWDDGNSEEPDNLTGVSERHLRLTTPRTEFPIGLPETIHEFYYDQGTYHLSKKIVNVHSPEGKIVDQEHYGSDGELWLYTRLEI